MLSKLRSLDAIDAPFALGDRVMPPAPVAAVATKAVPDWTRATMADILTDAERGALAEAFPVPKCIARTAVDMQDSAPVENRQRCRIDLSSANDPELRAVAERMAWARRPNVQAALRQVYGIAVGLASTEAQAANADADGWIAHDGKGMPVTRGIMRGTRVQVHLRWQAGSGVERGGMVAPAKDYAPSAEDEEDWWTHCGNDYDILAYRVVPQ